MHSNIPRGIFVGRYALGQNFFEYLITKVVTASSAAFDFRPGNFSSLPRRHLRCDPRSIKCTGVLLQCKSGGSNRLTSHHSLLRCWMLLLVPLLIPVMSRLYKSCY